MTPDAFVTAFTAAASAQAHALADFLRTLSPAESDTVLNALEAAQRLWITRRTLYRTWKTRYHTCVIAQGESPLRFSAKALEDYVASHTGIRVAAMPLGSLTGALPATRRRRRALTSMAGS